MPRIRIQRFEKELLKLVSTTINYKMRDKRLDFVSITSVKLTNDLSHAKFFYTHMQEDSKQEIQKVLEKSTGIIKQAIASAKLMRRIPDIVFQYDEVEENARKLDSIFAKIEAEKKKEN
ncbi:30S ribosome-binding factor RbfA [Candidatus Cloacimonadota bacterium]